MVTEEENLTRTRDRLWMLYGRVGPSPDNKDLDILLKFNFIKQIHNISLRLAKIQRERLLFPMMGTTLRTSMV